MLKEVEEEDNAALLVSASLVVGAVMVIGGVVTAGVAALGLLAGKDEAFKVANSLLAKSRGRRREGPRERHQRMLAAHQLLVYAAFLEAADPVLQIVKTRATSHVEAETLAKLAEGELKREPAAGDRRDHLKAQLIASAPRPAESVESYGRELHTFYENLATRLSERVAELVPDLAEDEQISMSTVLGSVADDAMDRYLSRFYTLAADHPQFKTWADLQTDEATRRSLALLPKAVADRLLSTLAEPTSLDVGFARFGEHLLAEGRRVNASQARDELVQRYEAQVQRPIAEERGSAEPEGAQIVFPPRGYVFVPQAFQVRRLSETGANDGLEDEATWSSEPVREDLSEFLEIYLQSSSAAEAPLLVLGHPGSGKSLLSEMIAARVAAQELTPLRLVLRDVDLTTEIYEQLERQIRSDTHGQQLAWADFAKGVSEMPPVVILDGFDEVLRAGGGAHARYLEAIQRFQANEASLGREVRVVITSRINLIDKARIPSGTTVLRLMDFDVERRGVWIERWNEHNEAYFKKSGVEPFALPNRRYLEELAGQPLLLFLLALFDADGNRLRARPGVDRTNLYDELLTRFVRRQRSKERTTAGLSDEDLGRIARHDVYQLGIASISMFNQGVRHLTRDQLERDLTFFDASGDPSADVETLFERFFFVHLSRAMGETVGADPSTTYEFLHSTFGEFLTADFILRGLLLVLGDAGTDTEPPGDWYARLMYTPLSSQPVVLEMMRSWMPHLLTASGVGALDVVDRLDAFITAEIARVIDGVLPSPALTAAAAPYPPLSLLGHYATYTMNLVMLRVAIVERPLVFNNATDPGTESRASRWDRLTHLWRSWFSVDTLAAVASIVETDHRGDHVHVRARESFTAPTGTAPLEIAWRAAAALGDRLTAGALGVHLYDAGDRQSMPLLEAGSDLAAESVELDLELLMRMVRSEGWPRDSEHLEQLAEHARRALALESTSRTHRDLLAALTASDAPPELRSTAGRAMQPPRFLDALWSLPDSFAAAYIRFCASLGPRWGAELVAEVLREDAPEQLARSSPQAFAACLDIESPSSPAVYALPVQEERSWIAPILRDLLRRNDLAPVVVVALVDLTIRIGPKLGELDLVAEAERRLLDCPPLDAMANASVGRMRRLVSVADASPNDDLADWLLSATDLILRDLPADVVFDLERLRLVVTRRRHVEPSAVDGWPMVRDPAELAALKRLLLQLDADSVSPSALGRKDAVRRLTDPDTPGPALVMRPELLADLSDLDG